MVRYSVTYFLVFASVGVFAPWLPPFLEQHHGLSRSFIGIALSVVMLSRAVLPPLWGLLLDRIRGRRYVLAVTVVLAGMMLFALLLPGSPATVLAWMAAYGFFWVPVVPLLETLTMQGLGESTERYGSIRLWGSAGFIVTSFGLGWLLDSVAITIVPLAAGLPFLASGAFAVAMPATPARERAGGGERRLPWRQLSPVLLATMLGQGSHGPYYVFFTIELTSRGVDSALIGALWALGVIAEIGLLALSPRLLPRLGLVRAIRWALILSALRWLVLGSTESLLLIAVVQLLHAVTYGLQHIATVQLVDEVTPKASKAFGQSVLNTAAYGMGVGGGLAVAGVLVDILHWEGLMWAAALVAALGWVASVFVKARTADRSSAAAGR